MIISVSFNDATLNLTVLGRPPGSFRKGAGSKKQTNKKTRLHWKFVTVSPTPKPLYRAQKGWRSS